MRAGFFCCLAAVRSGQTVVKIRASLFRCAENADKRVWERQCVSRLLREIGNGNVDTFHYGGGKVDTFHYGCLGHASGWDGRPSRQKRPAIDVNLC